MEILIQILQFILSLSLLIFIHELGHFIFARMFGVKVDKFYLFFDIWGFSLLKFKIGDTQFGIGWLPFGGYCKISGMIDESMDTEYLKSEPKPYEFRSKPTWQRLLIMTGGVIMNVVLAVIIYIGMSNRWGEQYIAPEDVRYGYMFSDLGREAGFRNGDMIVSVDGRPVGDFEDWIEVFQAIMVGDLPPVEVERDGELVTVEIPRGLYERMTGLSRIEEFMSPRLPFVVARVGQGSEAEKAGIMAGDSLVAVDGRQMMFFDEFQSEFAARQGETAEVVLVRQGVQDTLAVDVSPQGTIGVNPYSYVRFLPLQTRHYTLLQSIPNGFRRAGQQIDGYWQGLKLIVKPETGAYKSLGGFLSIGSMFDKQWDWQAFWSITALLSIVLAVMNILPIPMLDGGHVLFLLWEVITGRRPSDKFLEYAQIAGLIFVFALLIYANGNDIYRFFIK